MINEKQKHRRHERTKQRVIERLEEFAPHYPTEIMYRDGKSYIGHVQSVEREFDGSYFLLHAETPLNPDVEYGSKLDERDLFINTPLHELGYVRNPETGVKISFMAFRPPQ